MSMALRQQLISIGKDLNLTGEALFKYVEDGVKEDIERQKLERMTNQYLLL